MNALAMQSFGFGDHLVRAIDREGAAWFVGNDVCAALEIANPRDAMGRLDSDERDDVGIADAIGRHQNTTIISESGVYSLTFTSRKEAAKQFKRWVTHDVLPSLRMTGRYEMPVASDPAVPALETPDEFDALRTKLALAKEARIVFGVKAARKAWQAMALLPELTDDMPADRFGDLGNGPVAMVHRTVTDWLNARCEHAPGHRVPTMVLYDSYIRWTREEEVDRDEVQGVTGFGRALTNLGFAVKKTNRMHRVGLKLLE